jgi:hypothetical protein
VTVHSGPPPIPATCAHRPTIGGRVKPWINLELADGGIDFRRQHRSRVITALQRRLCQVCGTALRQPIVLFGGPNDLHDLIFSEPPLHAECGVYTSLACPVVAGERTTAPSGPSVSQGKRGKTCYLPGCDCDGWVPSTPDDATTEPVELHDWFAVYARNFGITYRPDGSILGAIVQPHEVLGVRLISRPGQGRCWERVEDALAGYEPPETTPVRYL